MATGDVPIRYGDYLVQRGGDRRHRLFYVRYPVPKDLQPHFGKSQIVKPLGTADPQEAKARSRAVIVEIEATLAAARSGLLTPAVIEAEARAVYEARLAEYGTKPELIF